MMILDLRVSRVCRVVSACQQWDDIFRMNKLLHGKSLRLLKKILSTAWPFHLLTGHSCNAVNSFVLFFRPSSQNTDSQEQTVECEDLETNENFCNM